MAILNENMIETIKNKIEIENHNLAEAIQEKEEDYRKNHKEIIDYDEMEKYIKLTDKEKPQHKIVYSNEELDFVINNYQGKVFLHQGQIFNTEELANAELLKNCIYLLKEFKQTKQTSKCNAVYNILNKYFTIENTYSEVYSLREDYIEWNGFKLTYFVKCPAELKEMIKAKVVKIKAEKQKQSIIDYKEKADKTDKEIIAELEL